MMAKKPVQATSTVASASTTPSQKVVLPHKEASLFKTILNLYEHKQYKKGLKSTEQILRKFPTHAESMAMKGLFLFQLEKKQEGYELAKSATLLDSDSHICWHVYGLMYRADNNYAEAAKCYVNALKIDKDNLQILRDLALLQIQLRNYAGCIETRKKLVNLLRGPHQRIQWLALAVLYHVVGNHTEAIVQLEEYEASLVPRPSPKDLEYSQVVLYRTQLMEERGDFQSALDHLETHGAYVVDVPMYRFRRAELLRKLGHEDDALGAYLQLIQMNPDHRPSIEGFLLTTRENRWGALQDLATQFPKSGLIPILLLQAFPVRNDRTDFDEILRDFLRKQIHKCVPSTYVQLKPILNVPEKVAILGRLLLELEANTPLDHSCSPWIQFFLAQHYDFLGDQATALNYIEKAIDQSLQQEQALEHDLNNSTPGEKENNKANGTSNNHSATSLGLYAQVPLEFYMYKARIYKHAGDLAKASQFMNAVREMDLKDRSVNTKCTKYMLRNNDLEAAEKTIQLFTLPNTSPLKDLTDLQCMWFFTERAEALVRLGRFEEALESYTVVFRHFDEIEDDQFDFHMYCLRKLCLSTYKDMLSMEQKLRRHPFFLHCAWGVLKVYLHLHDAQLPWHYAGSDHPATPLEAAAKLIKRMEEDGIDQHHSRFHLFAFQVYLRQERWLLALRALKKLAHEQPSTSGEATYRFFFHVVQLSVAAQSHAMPAPFKNAIDKECLQWWQSPTLLEYIDTVYAQQKHVFPYILAVARAYLELQLPEKADQVIRTWIQGVEASPALFLNGLKWKSCRRYIDEWDWLDRCQEVRSQLNLVIQNHFAVE